MLYAFQITHFTTVFNGEPLAEGRLVKAELNGTIRLDRTSM